MDTLKIYYYFFSIYLKFLKKEKCLADYIICMIKSSFQNLFVNGNAKIITQF